jgi:chaperonin GroEL
MEFDRGYLSPYLVTDTEKMVAVYEDIFILLTDKKNPIYRHPSVLEVVMQNEGKLLFVAGMLKTKRWHLILNKLERFIASQFKLRDSVTEEKKCLKDIAILTGATVISEEMGLELKIRPT